MSRTKKGRVAIQADKGWLRLRWSYGGKRHVMALGLPEDEVNRAIAQRQASIIEADIKAEQFDDTLNKYRNVDKDKEHLSVVALFERHTEWKRRQIDKRSIEKYIGLQGHLQQFFRSRQAKSVNEDIALNFRDWLLKKLKPITVRERIVLLRACWKWGIERKLVQTNPWTPVKVKVPPKQKSKPFTQQERSHILEGFHEHAPHFADLVDFMLSIGCRPGEAAGLRWRHLNEDCSSIWIGESWGRGQQKATKTNRDRSFELSSRLQVMLQHRRPEPFDPDGLVFSSPQGKPVDDKNFRNRYWKPVLEAMGVPYRKPYTTRHSFISQALDQGWSPSEIAAVTGNTEETILRHYVGSVKGKATLKDVWN